MECNLMDKLTINNILDAVDDLELCQYKVLGILQRYLNEIRSYKLFPAFSELKSIEGFLSNLQNRKSYIKKLLLEKIAPFSAVSNNGIYFEPEEFDEDIISIIEFIDWLQPKIREALNEAYALFDFVTDNIKIEEIAGDSKNKKEGLLILPDFIGNCYHIFRYEYYNFSNNGEEITSLRTTELETFSMGGFNPGKLKQIILKIAEKKPDLSTPGMFNCKSELELPFKETILPVAKRVLLELMSIDQ